ncbi:uncharacterized protein LOC124889647 [Capsicum annuum]|uniref:uncharacterized protein LOC124889647 n=1 Tax=Capsicum annuum TaxID=4072 RepID=UPI001FB0E260|nr:uncharacterized protein LOC124889647 [Capsicum annuum]
MGFENLNFERQDSANSRMNKMNELDEFRLRAYESSAFYKENMKLHHDRMIEKRFFEKGKLKSGLYGLFTVLRMFPYGALELKRDGDVSFKENGYKYVETENEMKSDQSRKRSAEDGKPMQNRPQAKGKTVNK